MPQLFLCPNDNVYIHAKIHRTSSPAGQADIKNGAFKGNTVPLMRYVWEQRHFYQDGAFSMDAATMNSKSVKKVIWQRYVHAPALLNYVHSSKRLRGYGLLLSAPVSTSAPSVVPTIWCLRFFQIFYLKKFGKKWWRKIIRASGHMSEKSAATTEV